MVAGKRLEAVRIEAHHSNLPTIVMLHEGLGIGRALEGFPAPTCRRNGRRRVCLLAIRTRLFGPLREATAVSYMHHEAQIVLPEILQKAHIERPCF